MNKTLKVAKSEKNDMAEEKEEEKMKWWRKKRQKWNPTRGHRNGWNKWSKREFRSVSNHLPWWQHFWTTRMRMKLDVVPKQRLFSVPPNSHYTIINSYESFPAVYPPQVDRLDQVNGVLSFEVEPISQRKP